MASPTDPWGQTVPASTTHAGWTYREVFARDSYETFTGLLADGDRPPRARWSRSCSTRPSSPTAASRATPSSTAAVAPDTFGLSEIDEVAYPLLMAWEAGLSGNAAFYPDHVRPAADYIVDHGPSTGAERWEEHPGYSPATIASEIAGLVAAGHLAQAAGDTARAHLYLATADDYQRNVKAWTVTTTGPDGPPLLHPRVGLRQPQHQRDLQPGQRQPQQRRPALDHRRRLPRADADG